MQPRPAHPCGVSVCARRGLAEPAGWARIAAQGPGQVTGSFPQQEGSEAGRWASSKMADHLQQRDVYIRKDQLRW